MDVGLERMLAVVAAGVHTGARAALMAVLPPPLRATVAHQLESDDGGGGWTSDLEQRIAASLKPPPDPTPDVREDGAASPGPEARDTEARRDAADGGDGSGQPVQEVASGNGDGAGFQEAAADASVRLGVSVVLAMLCAAAPSQAGNALLVRLPLHLQVEIVLVLCARTVLSATRGLDAAGTHWVEQLRVLLDSSERWGTKITLQLLRSTGSARHLRLLLSAANLRDHERISALRSELYSFEDLLRLADPELQTVLLKVANDTLGLALTLTEPRVRKQLLRNISARRRAEVEEEAQRFAAATLGEVETAQAEIMTIAQSLYEQQAIRTYLGSVSATAGAEWVESSAPMVPRQGEPAQDEEGEGIRRTALAGLLVHPAVLVVLSVVLTLTLVWLGAQRVRDSASPPSARPRSAPLASATLRGAVGIRQGESAGIPGPTSHRRQDADGETPVSPSGSILAPGEHLSTAAGVQAVLEFPRAAQVDVEANTEVARSEADVEAVPELFLRLGRVRVEVVGEGFRVRTPAALAQGDPSAAFTVKVVLDGSTEVEVARGQVRLRALTADAPARVLSGGQRAHLAVSGN